MTAGSMPSASITSALRIADTISECDLMAASLASADGRRATNSIGDGEAGENHDGRYGDEPVRRMQQEQHEQEQRRKQRIEGQA